MTAVPAAIQRMKSPPMADQSNMPEFRVKDDRDMLVLLLARADHIAAGVRELRASQTDMQKDLSMVKTLVDRHENRLLHLDHLMTERKIQMDHVTLDVQKLKEDVMGRLTRMQEERLDPIDDKINQTNVKISNARNWIAGAMFVIAILWVFGSPWYAQWVATLAR